jgi:hypothetical protein
MYFFDDTRFEHSGDYIKDQITLFQRQIVRMEREQQQLHKDIITRRNDVVRLQAALAHPGIKPTEPPKS